MIYNDIMGIIEMISVSVKGLDTLAHLPRVKQKPSLCKLLSIKELL
jgi:hypothetical protein